MRSTHLLNHGWLFAPRQVELRVADEEFTPITLPHTNIVLPRANFDNARYQFVSTYRKRFTLPEERRGQRVFVDFDGAMLVSTVALNGHTLGTHAGGYTPFSYDITEHLVDGVNVLTVLLDSTERPDVPPFGYVVDYLTFGGIYRDVHLRYVPECHIADVFARPRDVLSEHVALDVDVTLAGRCSSATLRATLHDAAGTQVASAEAALAPATAGTHTLTLAALGKLALWQLDQPTLYTLEVALHADDGTPADAVSTRIGFRDARWDAQGRFVLNGQPLKLFGLNRHQTYPYIGAAAPARLQRQDADILKQELGCNMVRTSHYPQSRHFLDRCDEIGLLVFEEIPGWQHVGDEDWQALSLRDVEVMIRRDRNRPSVVLWGVRINESLDNDAFYAKTNALARHLDPTRATGGVRFFQRSTFLEDVFTYNDFSNGIEEPLHQPHLVTEFNGHMFPSKPWDSEERLIEHALRHARVHNQQYGMNNVSGAIGWCAFDYNTHREFGSGDRVCYHGVMDIFRLPKWAARFYESQQPPSQRVVLAAATHWTMGDRSAGGNDPLTVFTNCDQVEVFYGQERLGLFAPDHATYPYLPHPPVTITGLSMTMTWGAAFGDLRLVGYVGGAPVAEQHIAADRVPRTLHLSADAEHLVADGMDTTRVVVRATDVYGNPLPYAFLPVTLACDGPAGLIGENPLVLAGGQAAVYLRTRQQPGVVTVTASAPGLPDVSIRVNVEAAPV